MRVDYINREIMEDMLQGIPMPRYAPIPAGDGEKEGRYIVSTSGLTAYILDRNEICFNLARCRCEPAAFEALLADDTLLRIDNMLEPTMDVRVAKKESVTLGEILDGASTARLLARFKGSSWDVFVDMALLEAFDNAKYYQARRYGPVAVVEDGVLVGYVMPTKSETAEGHYTDSPSYDDE